MPLLDFCRDRARLATVAPPGRLGTALGLLILFCYTPSSPADIIYLKNGKRLIVQRVWEDGNKLRYEKDGNVFGFSKELVARVESGSYFPDPRDTAESARKPVSIEVLDSAL